MVLQDGDEGDDVEDADGEVAQPEARPTGDGRRVVLGASTGGGVGSFGWARWVHL